MTLLPIVQDAIALLALMTCIAMANVWIAVSFCLHMKAWVLGWRLMFA